MVHANVLLEKALGKKLTNIETPMELLFLFELDKYTKEFLDERLDISGISVPKYLESTPLFSYVVMNGLKLNYDMDKLPDYSYIKFFKGKVRTKNGEGIHLVEEDGCVTYNYSSDVMKNKIMWVDGRPFSYVSLISYLIVKSYIEDKALPLLVIDHMLSYFHIQFEYSPLLILMNYGNKLLNGKIDLKIDKESRVKVEWESFVMHNRHLGYMDKEYTMNEKFNFLSRNYEVGDVVLLYTKKLAGKTDGIGKLVSCYPAIIKGMSNTHVFLHYYPNVKTVESYKKEINEVNNILISNGQEPHYSYDDLYFSVSKENIPLSDIGIEGYSYLEKYLIIPCHDMDGTCQIVDGVEDFYNTVETVWVVFNDWGLDFDKQKFLKRYKKLMRKDLVKKYMD